MEVKLKLLKKNLNLLSNNILKELRGNFFMSIGRVFQSGKALFTDLNKLQLLLDLMTQIMSFEQVL